MSLFEIRADIKPAMSLLGNVGKQLPFASAIALNRTADDAAAAVRQGLGRDFVLRTAKSRTFLTSTILSPGLGGGPADSGRSYLGATKDNLRAHVQVNPAAGFNILARFAQGGIKTARDANFPFAIPTKAIRPSFAGTVPQTLLPKSLGLVPSRNVKGGFDLHARGKSRKAGFHVTSRGQIQLKGKQRTFVIGGGLFSGGTAGAGNIFQRFGPGPHDIRLIWAFRKQITDPPLLHFEETLRRVVGERWAINWNGAMAVAIASAR